MERKTNRRNQLSDETRRRLLDAATEIAAERGYDGTSLTLITKRSGLPASSVYWHFGSKDELLAAVIEHSFQEWLPAVPRWAPMEPGTDRREHLREVLRQAGRSLVDRPEFMRLGLMLSLERRVVEPAARARFLEIRAMMLKAMSGWWESALSEDVLKERPSLPLQLARLHIATSDGLFTAAQIPDEGFDVEELMELLAEALDSVVERIVAELADDGGEASS
ncbi:AcrR family transcriptional regulator [Spinactinospora alkalitolerans]|uniref:AcrR family transcriptional regulator n=1 Tax=Spinactinospora alkalitolerans TaxID=687207 RepID=A0A852TS07_9ACTN|nr:TetR/AcrR family transcriptional regulator [Spinactinospora alkalitolerans]NYE47176.1 AcrR family transcriptional regulator [Spinactinospora alkalitolerans]